MTPSTTPPRPARHTQRTRLTRVAVLAVLGALAALLLPAPAAQATNYRFWGYYQLAGGAWTFSANGPDKTTPAEGAVEGWRWGIDDGTGKNPRAPRAVPAFAAVCGATPAAAGRKRVAVVVDFGRPADAETAASTPPAAVARCASVATAATGSEVLAAVTSVRTAGGLVCGLDGYPAAGCGAEVAALTPEQQAADTPVAIAAATPTPTAVATAAPATVAPAAASSGIPVGVWVGLLVVLLAVAALVWSARRRQSAA